MEAVEPQLADSFVASSTTDNTFVDLFNNVFETTTDFQSIDIPAFFAPYFTTFGMFMVAGERTKIRYQVDNVHFGFFESKSPDNMQDQNEKFSIVDENTQDSSTGSQLKVNIF